ncbi:MAG: hypothetical protein EZS28_008424 [Streblomastix strix]|uniref:Uncharacterized protein n=1 Tax=Streblomastix strix TaxID=222440 RepID=A0A5J4WMN3_9EUKA|nr:MAG: hypothetical protein EZS28_008424 [Streblomastix strix]
MILEERELFNQELLKDSIIDEVIHLILEKKPYSGLIRLLEHTDDNIVNNAIASIFNIQLSGSSTTPESDPHPHCESIQESDGIMKIFALFQKNQNKFSRDRSALCIGYLLSEQGRKNNELRKRIISSGIVEVLINIIENRDLKNVSSAHVKIIYELTSNTNDEVKLLLYHMHILPGLIRLLEHTNGLIIFYSIYSIYEILEAGANSSPITSQHPYFDSMEQNGDIERIFELYRKSTYKGDKEKALYCLCILFRAREIADPIMRQEIINHLKSLLNDSDAWVKQTAKDVLKYLSQNAANRSEILNETELMKIEQDLKQPIEGTQEQQKNITQRQETDVLLLSLILEGRNDNELRKRILSSGIVESLLTIFIKRDLNSITRTYSLAFFHLTNLSNNEVILLIAEKKPYPGLIRLLEHTVDDIVNDSISSIFHILQTGSNTSPESDPHPHYQSLQQFDGIKKIFALFKKNIDKYKRDRSALCIGFLFRARKIADPIMRQEIIGHLKSLLNDDDDQVKQTAKDQLKYLSLNAANRSETLNGQELKRIEQDLKQPIEGTQEQQKNITQKQETDLLLLSSVIEGRNDNKLRKRIMFSGIVESLLLIFINRDLNQITRTYSFAFVNLTNPSSDENIHLLLEKKPYPGLIRLLEHADNLIASDAIGSIGIIQFSGSNTTPQSDPHPHYESIQKNDGIKKIFALFQKNGMKFNRYRSALCIGYLFKAREIADPIMRQEIINHLKCLLNEDDDWVKERAKDVLKYLSQNTVNKAEIEAGGFTIPK